MSDIEIGSEWRDKKSGELVYIESLDSSIWNINFNSLDNINKYANSTEEFLSQHEFVCDSRFDSCLAFDGLSYNKLVGIQIGQTWKSKENGLSCVITNIEMDNGVTWVTSYSEKYDNTRKDILIDFVSMYEFVGGVEGKKDDSQKIRYSLLPVGTVNQVVQVLEFGSKKYADNNWQKVPNARTRYYDAALRHIDLWWQGEKSDSETGLHHLAHAICCLMFLIWFDGDAK